MKFKIPALAAAVLSLSPALAHANPPAIGDTSVFVTLPAAPGFPEQPITSGNKLYVTTDAHFGTVGQPAPEVQIFNRSTGALLERVALKNVDLTQEHGMSAGAFDLFNRLYVLSVEQGVVRINFATGQQDIYSPPLPFLPMCSAVPAGTPCSQKIAALPPLSNDIAFNWDGSAFVTDSFQGIIFKIPAGGGAPRIWFQDARLLGPVGGFGVNGLRVSADLQSVYFNVTTEASTGDGVVYTLPNVARPQAKQLREFHRWSNGSGSPDDLAFGLSGRLYVSLAYQNVVSVLDRNGNELYRLPSSAQGAAAGVPLLGVVPAFQAAVRRHDRLQREEVNRAAPGPAPLRADDWHANQLALLAREHGLTGAEREVLGLVAEGLSNREIAQRRFVSLETIRTHVQRILGKLDVRTRTQAALYVERALVKL